MLSVLSVALLILLYLSTQQVQAAANFTSSSTGQNVKLLIQQAITSLNSGDAKAALSNLTLADKLLGG
jgi:hypothetical protein